MINPLIYMIIMAFSLSIDAVGIGISYGIRGIKISAFAKFVICAMSFLIILLSMLFGDILYSLVPKYIGQIIGSLILFIMGFLIILQGVKSKKEIRNKKKKKTLRFIIKPLGISIKIIQSPEFCDFNKSRVIEPLESVYLGIALSFDSIGVGMTSSIFNFNEFVFSLLVCVFQIFLLSCGILSGGKINKIKNIDKISNIVSGTILILISAIKLFF